jgi:hypothetical protein
MSMASLAFIGLALGIFGTGFGLGGLHANRRWRKYIDSRRVHGARTVGWLRETVDSFEAAGIPEHEPVYLGLSDEEARARYGRRLNFPFSVKP